MEIDIAISPCPNDTFIFDALVNQKIDTKGLSFKVHFADVEQLNQAAFNNQFTITKLSYHAYAYANEHYSLLNSGSALGNNCGPLLIASTLLDDVAVNESVIAIPGKYTTANFLFSIKYPAAQQKQFMLFSDIENAIINKKVNAGVIIHENRFTYAQKGLLKIIDLGEFWKSEYQLPIPLGGIAIQRTIDIELQKTIDDLIKQSIEYAYKHQSHTTAFVTNHAQEMDSDILLKHINLYVNNYSITLGEKGKQAIQKMYAVGVEKGIIPPLTKPIFME
ncbi:MAG: 1,4-dihydroxy-6-naphthoate synthase [Chitinophagales bacterium]|nr:1,4-dihydroxy-6-naphthoate synthase [Chitinophagales bacterium]